MEKRFPYPSFTPLISIIEFFVPLVEAHLKYKVVFVDVGIHDFNDGL
jgi:hypothetical protein